MRFKVPLLRLGVETIDRRTMVPEGQFTLHPDGAPIYRLTEGMQTQIQGKINYLSTEGGMIYAGVQINSQCPQVGAQLRAGELVLLAEMFPVDYNVREQNMLILKGVVQAAKIDLPAFWPWKE